MKIAIPLAGGRLAQHFGHCESFALIDIDPASNQIQQRVDVASPPHQPGLLPAWLAERGATVIIAGGMGQRAQALFANNGITVLTGCPADTPEHIVSQYLSGALQLGENACDH